MKLTDYNFPNRKSHTSMIYMVNQILLYVVYEKKMLFMKIDIIYYKKAYNKIEKRNSIYLLSLLCLKGE